MKASARTLLLLGGLAISLAAQADPGATGARYKWTDGHGGVHFSDTLPPEALQMGYDVVNAQGMIVRHVDRPRTREERMAEALALSAQSEARRGAADAAAADRLLIATYQNETDLAHVHQDRLDAIDQTLRNVNVSLADQEKGLSEQLAHAATFESNGKPVPASVRQEIEALRKTIAEQHAFISHREQERVDLMHKSDLEIAHYRELRAKQEQAAQQ